MGAPFSAPGMRTRVMPTGTVKWFNTAKGYGFIAPDDGGKDAFVHIKEVQRSGLGEIVEGQRVSFEVRNDPRGIKAINLSLVD